MLPSFFPTGYRSFRTVEVVVLTAALLWLHALRLHGQPVPDCGTRSVNHPPTSASLVNPQPGRLPTSGTLRVLMLFIDFSDDVNNPGNGLWPVGKGPSFLADVIDTSVEQRSGEKYNVTTFFRDMSGGRLDVIGDAVYVQAPKPLWRYMNSTTNDGQPEPETQSESVPEFVVRDVLRKLDATIDFARYDGWTRRRDSAGRWSVEAGPDDVVDMIMVCYRNAAKEPGGFNVRYRGIASLSGADNFRRGLFDLDGGARHADYGELGSGLTTLGQKDYPHSLQVVYHEFGHYLLDPDVHQYRGGVWSIMGSSEPSVSYFMNAYERSLVGWCEMVDLDRDTVVSLPDFGTSGRVYRIVMADSGTNHWFILENHRCLPSPYITSSPDNFTYDLVDRTHDGAPGLYILQYREGELDVVCADGRWNWSNPSWTAAPWNSAQKIPVFERETLNRISGRTDRDKQTYIADPVTLLSGETFVYAWVDEQSRDTVRDAPPRLYGDGNDAWTPERNNVFSPWSNPSSSVRRIKKTVGLELLGEDEAGLRARFYTKPEEAPPSKPQGLQARYDTSTSESRPVLVTWFANTEPDVRGETSASTAPGFYEIWRRSETYEGEAVEGWRQIGTAPGNVGAYHDAESLWLPGGLLPPVRFYTIRAIDADDRGSLFSDSARVVPQGLTRFDGASGGLVRNYPNPFDRQTTIVYTVPSDGDVTLSLYDILGRRIGVLAEGFREKGLYSVELDALGLAPGSYGYLYVVGGEVHGGTMLLQR